MANYKILTVNFPDNEMESALVHYEKMGFQVISGSHVTSKNEHGTIVNSYYKYNMKFDLDQKNGDKLWETYAAYKKKRAELKVRRFESVGATYMSGKLMLMFTVIFGIILLPFIPMIFGNDFFDFTHTTGFLFDVKREFDAVMFFSSLAISFLSGLAIGTVIEAIYAAVTRNKRMVLAIDRIPALEDEIDELIKKAEELRN